jgi:hypothetical protein
LTATAKEEVLEATTATRKISLVKSSSTATIEFTATTKEDNEEVPYFLLDSRIGTATIVANESPSGIEVRDTCN